MRPGASAWATAGTRYQLGTKISGRLPLNTPINAHNRRYLAALAHRAGHMLDGLLAPDGDSDKKPPTQLRSGPPAG